MHHASIVLAAGADFRLLGPHATMLESRRPVIAVTRGAHRAAARARRAARSAGSCATPGSGSRSCGTRCPTATSRRCASSASRRSPTSTRPTRRSRSARSTRRPSSSGWSCTPASTTATILARAEEEADVIVWDGGNNDFPFYEPDLHITVTDPLRAGPRARLPPRRDQPAHGRRRRRQQGRLGAGPRTSSACWRTSPRSTRRDGDPRRVARDASTPARRSRAARVLVVDDGPTLTHGGMAFGAGTVAARAGRRGRARRPAAVRRRHDRGDVRALPAPRRRAAGDGLRRRPAARARRDDRPRSVRRRRHRHARSTSGA